MFLAPSKLISLQRQSNGFGFTLRHFVVYPPELIKKSSEVRASIVVRITSDTLTFSPLMFPRSLTILMSGQRLFLKTSKLTFWSQSLTTNIIRMFTVRQPITVLPKILRNRNVVSTDSTQSLLFYIQEKKQKMSAFRLNWNKPYTLTLKCGNLAIQQEFCNVKFNKLLNSPSNLKERLSEDQDSL